MMTKTIISLAVAGALTGCGTIGNAVRTMPEPEVIVPRLKAEPDLKEPMGGPIAVAVYGFRDQTGQRKSSQTIATLSSAVTQGADSYLIKSLQEVGNGRWFKVLERGGLDNLVKERQLIRQMRELYQGNDAQPLPPMLFAGMLLEGGIVGYDSNTMSGGSGARLLGIGASTEYRQDEVTVSLRAVSVATGEVLVTVTTTKKVISFQDKMGVLRFNTLGTESLELETGAATNESMNKAVQVTIHAAVIEMIQQGARKGHWAFKEDKKPVVIAPVPAPVPAAQPSPVSKENQNELVQNNPAPQVTVQETSQDVKPDERVESRDSQQSETIRTAPSNSGTVEERFEKIGVVKEIGALRTEKLLMGERIMRVMPGTEVKIIRGEDFFYLVRVGEVEGWIHMRFIKVQKVPGGN